MKGILTLFFFFFWQVNSIKSLRVVNFDRFRSYFDTMLNHNLSHSNDLSKIDVVFKIIIKFKMIIFEF
jgi:hypothetical protein